MIIDDILTTTAITVIVFSPLMGALISGLGFKYIKRQGVNFFTTIFCMFSFLCSVFLAYGVFNRSEIYSVKYYEWASITNKFHFDVGFTVDRLSAYMMLIVTFVSTLVHVYSIGYMKEDDGYGRFFSYISAFTFAMLCLVMGDNLLLLFFGWEGVGLFSYLLIGFYFNRNKAVVAGFKAFIFNRVGDLGFLLGIGAVIFYTGSIDYQDIFATLPNVDNEHLINFLGMDFSPVTLICVLLFIGAMGKSAQFPLHSWLEGSMEGPTPISALIHAATMVTAGVFMIARLSPVFAISESALSFVMCIGAITCLFMGLVTIIFNLPFFMRT